MLIQKWKNDNNLYHFSQFYQGYIIFKKFVSKENHVYNFRKLQYFEFLSWCENIKESCQVLSEIFFIEMLSRPECSGCAKLLYVKIYPSKNPKS